MSKTKVIIFVLMGALVHFGLAFVLILQRISCGIQPRCVGLANEVGVKILEFPLNAIAAILYLHELKAGGWLFIALPINSLVAVLIIWFVLVRPLINRAKRKASSQ
jgi:hypothetical protein